MGGVLKAQVAESLDDAAWDGYLQGTALGQYQQSSLWARAKAVEGWQPVRAIYLRGQEIVGGFQMLCRKSRLGRIAYISKGPVITDDDPEGWELAVRDIKDLVHERGIIALIVQQPDDSAVGPAAWAQWNFEPNRVMSVITSTQLIDLSEGRESVERHMHPETRRKIRQAATRGVTVREGTREDIGLFFNLMLMTCRRQGEKRPNPPTEDALRVVWDAFQTRLRMRLTFAEYEGEPIAGQLNFLFGGRAVLYKKGWSSQHGDCRPNYILNNEAISWACAEGMKTVDFSALNRGIAETLLAGRPLSKEHLQCRDMFNLGFGGYPKLLPPAYVYIPNRLFNSAYKKAAQMPWLLKLIRGGL